MVDPITIPLWLAAVYGISVAALLMFFSWVAWISVGKEILEFVEKRSQSKKQQEYLLRLYDQAARLRSAVETLHPDTDEIVRHQGRLIGILEEQDNRWKF